MGRVNRQTQKNNIVLICEGTETEYQYFNDIRNHVLQNFPEKFCDISIVPTAEEFTLANSRNKKLKKLRTPYSHSSYFYYVQFEDNKEDYEKYKSQPTRYVREAQLFMLNNGYMEAWAIFDKDQFHDHEKAFKLASEVNGLNIAFSSISFETWILLHFERCERSFCRSVCKENRKDILCGSNLNKNDCHGLYCVGGYIRERGYIVDYHKEMPCLFDILKPKIQFAMLNTAWMRGQFSKHNIWESNPLTTVDFLIRRFLDFEEYEWMGNEAKFNFGSNKLNYSQNVLHNIGENIFINEIVYFSKHMDIIKTARFQLNPGECKTVSILKNAYYIGIKDKFKTKIFVLDNKPNSYC